MTELIVTVVAFAAMEGVSYAAHRWVMHGWGMRWHRSHHRPPVGRWERNDAFPAVFSVVGVMLFALGAWVWPTLTWVGVGVSAYGLAYLIVHELVIHRRLPGFRPRGRYLCWLVRAHAEHHRTSGEPFGMLLPLRAHVASSRGDIGDLGEMVTDHLDRSARAARMRANR